MIWQDIKNHCFVDKILGVYMLILNITHFGTVFYLYVWIVVDVLLPDLLNTLNMGVPHLSQFLTWLQF